MADNDIGLWIGVCTGCGIEHQYDDTLMRDLFPEHAESLNIGTARAMCECEEYLTLTLLPSVQVIPFSAWNVVPPASGCQQCGREHPDELPHDAQSLTYQYWFRNQEAKAGRPERWPTWDDAMAHCTEPVQETWRATLVEMGIIAGAETPAAEDADRSKD